MRRGSVIQFRKVPTLGLDLLAARKTGRLGTLKIVFEGRRSFSVLEGQLAGRKRTSLEGLEKYFEVNFFLSRKHID